MKSLWNTPTDRRTVDANNDGICDGQTVEHQTVENLQGIRSRYLITSYAENRESKNQKNFRHIGLETFLSVFQTMYQRRGCTSSSSPFKQNRT